MTVRYSLLLIVKFGIIHIAINEHSPLTRMESSCLFRLSAAVFLPYLTMLSGQAFHSHLEFSSQWSCHGPSTHMICPTPGHVHTPALSLAGFRAEGSSRVCWLLEEVTSFKAHFLSVRDNFFSGSQGGARLL